MKKVLFGLAFLGAMAFSGSILFAQGMEEPGGSDYKWKQRVCPSTQETYEVCWISGDGNACDEWGQMTRDCQL
jgi:hypothetical protein